jgi:hypothetical protein
MAKKGQIDYGNDRRNHGCMDSVVLGRSLDAATGHTTAYSASVASQRPDSSNR